MAEQPKPRELTDIVEKIKKVWSPKTFVHENKNQTVQKIIFEQGPALNCWNYANVFEETDVGKYLTVTDVYIRKNNKNYDEFNTTEDSTITLSDSKTNLSHITKPGSHSDNFAICPHCGKPFTIRLEK